MLTVGEARAFASDRQCGGFRGIEIIDAVWPIATAIFSMFAQHGPEKSGRYFVMLLIGFFRHQRDRGGPQSTDKVGADDCGLDAISCAIVGADFTQALSQKAAYAGPHQHIGHPAALDSGDNRLHN